MFSPKRLSASLDDMRRKVIAKRISRDLSRNTCDTSRNTGDFSRKPHQLLPINPNTQTINVTNPSVTKQEPVVHNTQHRQPHKEEYILIPEQDMSFATEKQCKELDIYNESLYKKSYKLYHEIMTKLAGSNLELKQVPQSPPNPNNLHRLINYRQRNQDTNCLRQTAAVGYLLCLGYKLTAHNQFSGSDNQQLVYEHKLFEPYQAIELAATISTARNENYLDMTSELFNRMSISESRTNTQPTAPPTRPPAFNQDYLPLYPQINSELEPEMMLSTGLSDSILPYYLIPDRRATAPARLIPSTPISNTSAVSHQQTGIECQHPEHHSVPEKIIYFDVEHKNQSS